MIFSTALTLMTFALIEDTARAVPVRRSVASNSSSTTLNVTQILNFALRLEQLENVFYTQGLQKYSQQDFLDAGYPSWARGRWLEIAEHEVDHVNTFANIIGDDAVKPCTYNFPDTDVDSFVAFSYTVETLGTTAWSSVPRLLGDNEDLVAAASVTLAVEASQSSWINSAIYKANPWSTAFSTPLDLNQVWTLASPVIVSCPSTNMYIPVTAFPSLTFPSTTQPGQTVQVSFTANNTNSEPLYVAFIQGLNATILPFDASTMQVTIPSELQGVVFAAIVNDSTSAGDDVTVAGPARLNFDFNSNGQDELTG